MTFGHSDPSTVSVSLTYKTSWYLWIKTGRFHLDFILTWILKRRFLRRLIGILREPLQPTSPPVFKNGLASSGTRYKHFFSATIQWSHYATLFFVHKRELSWLRNITFSLQQWAHYRDHCPHTWTVLQGDTRAKSCILVKSQSQSRYTILNSDHIPMFTGSRSW